MMMNIKKLSEKILPKKIYETLKNLYFVFFIRITGRFMCARGRISSCFENLRIGKDICDYEIDFVITWVDSSDVKWQNEKAKYSNRVTEDNNPICRYRDWDTLAFWFRAIEKYAPWVRKIFFVTCGQKPDWLDEKNEKIVLISHSDFMPDKYLPAFSSDPIELNLWRIPDLSEHFVYFNDDMFLNRPVKPSDFFCNGLPKLCPIAKPFYPSLAAGSNDGQRWTQRLFNDTGVINSTFNIRRQMEIYYSKWFSYKLKWNLKYNRRLYDDGYCSGIINQHLIYPIIKSEMNALWECQYALLDETSMKKFRTSDDVTMFLTTLWMIFRGKFHPINDGYYGHMYVMNVHEMVSITKAIKDNKKMIVCINDSARIDVNQFNYCKSLVQEVFLQKFPRKSSFEFYDHYE